MRDVSLISEGNTMTRLVDGGLLIEPEAPQTCELCGKTAECRPYGPKGEQVCFDCGMKDEQAVMRQFARRLGIQTH